MSGKYVTQKDFDSLVDAVSNFSASKHKVQANFSYNRVLMVFLILLALGAMAIAIFAFIRSNQTVESLVTTSLGIGEPDGIAQLDLKTQLVDAQIPDSITDAFTTIQTGHIDDADIHKPMDNNATTSNTLWSSSKTQAVITSDIKTSVLDTKGVAGGIPELDIDSEIPREQLPAAVHDVYLITSTPVTQTEPAGSSPFLINTWNSTPAYPQRSRNTNLLTNTSHKIDMSVGAVFEGLYEIHYGFGLSCSAATTLTIDLLDVATVLQSVDIDLAAGEQIHYRNSFDAILTEASSARVQLTWTGAGSLTYKAGQFRMKFMDE